MDLQLINLLKLEPSIIGLIFRVKTLFFTGSERLAKELNIPVVFGEMKKIKRGKYQMEFKLIADNPLKLKDKEITEIYKKWSRVKLK